MIYLAGLVMIGLIVIIGNQRAALRKMDDLQRSADDLNQKLRTVMNKDK